MPPGRRPRQHRFFLDRIAEWLSHWLRGPFVIALVGIITVGDLVCCVYYTGRIVRSLFIWYTSQKIELEIDEDEDVDEIGIETEGLGLTNRLRLMRPYVLGILVSPYFFVRT
ncbi:hypothetical protein BDV12DRAFT_201542 [Aspergillus spectabilis]